MFKKGLKRSPEDEQKRIEGIRNSLKFKAYNERRTGIPRPEVGSAISKGLGTSEKRRLFVEQSRGKPHKMSEEWRQKNKQQGERRIGARLTLEQRKNHADGSQKGENHYLWKGGKQRYSKTGTNFEKSLWRESIFCRDNCTCQRCGKTNLKGMDCIAHHIKDWDNYPELRFKIDNGLTVCRPCHTKKNIQTILQRVGG